MAKTKMKNKASGYEFRALFAGIDDSKEWTNRLKEIAKKEHRSVSMQARVLLMYGIQTYEIKHKDIKGEK
jgi:hypothetical protein